eukprot:5606388-Lingulodinium_polyedra.AAC.1
MRCGEAVWSADGARAEAREARARAFGVAAVAHAREFGAADAAREMESDRWASAWHRARGSILNS